MQFCFATANADFQVKCSASANIFAVHSLSNTSDGMYRMSGYKTQII